MEPNAFVGKKTKPSEAELSKALGPAKSNWDRVIRGLKTDCPTREWNCYSLKAGWSLKLKNKDRTILYLSPLAGGFRVSFVLGDKAVRAARASALPESAIKMIDEAKRYAEGSAIRFEVRTADDFEVVKKLAAIKRAN